MMEQYYMEYEKATERYICGDLPPSLPLPPPPPHVRKFTYVTAT